MSSDLVAASTTYSKKLQGARQVNVNGAWQGVAWDFWGNTPEVRFAASWVGNSMGRATLFAAKFDAEGKIDRAPDDHPATEIVKTIGGGTTGQSQLLGEYGPHLTVAGEGWTVIIPKGDRHIWRVLSVLEVQDRNGQLECEIEGVPMIVPAYDPDAPIDPTQPLAIRVWNPSPRRYIEADSAIRSSFDLLNELQLLNAAVAAISKSRLTGRGLVFIPQGCRFPTSAATPDAEDDLLAQLVDIATIAYSQPDSAAAAVPIFVEVPAEFIGQVQRMTFESDFDDLALKLREETIRRFASSLDTPAEILLGQGDISHWGVWAMDDTAIRLAVEPKLKCLCDAYTVNYLQPALQGLGIADADEWIVWYDTSGLRARTNQSETAVKLRELDAIGNEALRRETNFSDDDAPTPQELLESKIRWILPSVPTEYVEPLLGLMGIHVEPLPVAPTDSPPGLPSPRGPSNDPAPVDTNLPVDGPPVEVAPPDDGLMASADALIYRALERAGQRIRSRSPRANRAGLEELSASIIHVKVPVGPETLDELLHEAWDRVPEVAERYGIDCGCLTASLDQYCRDLLIAGVEHCWAQMPAFMTAPCLDGAA